MSTTLPFDLDGEMMAAIYPKRSYPVLSFGYSFSFVLNMSGLVDHETFTLAPSHELRRANEAEIAAINDVLKPYTHDNWAPWEYDPVKEHGSSGTKYHRRPAHQWRYFVVAFEGPNSTMIDVERAFCAASVELKIGFTLMQPIFEAKRRKTTVDAVLHSPGRLFSQLQGATRGSLPFFELASADAHGLKTFIEQVQSSDETLIGIKRITRRALDLDALPSQSPLLFLGYFAILESMLTHQPEPDDTTDSITRQVRQKLMLLDNRWLPRIDYGPFGSTKPETIWSKMYGYRSCLAHGSEPDFKKDLHLLGDHDRALKLLKQTVRSVLRQALSEPQLIVDLRNC